jgi:hypothetical protein
MVPVPGPTFEKVTVPVPVPVPAPYLDHKKQIFKKNFGNFFDFTFYKEKVHEFQQIYGKMCKKKTFNEGNPIHNFMSSSGSGTVISYGSGSDFLTSYGSGYGSGSTSQKVTVPTVPVPVPVPQHCHNGTGEMMRKIMNQIASVESESFEIFITCAPTGKPKHRIQITD